MLHRTHAHRSGSWLKYSALGIVVLTAGSMVGCQSSTRGSAKVSPVQAELSSAETQVGTPVVLTITVKNALVRQPPHLESLPDFTIEQSAGTSGRNKTYSLLLTPTKQGTLTIPSLTIQTFDCYYQTETFTVVVTEPRAESVPIEIKG